MLLSKMKTTLYQIPFTSSRIFLKCFTWYNYFEVYNAILGPIYSTNYFVVRRLIKHISSAFSWICLCPKVAWPISYISQCWKMLGLMYCFSGSIISIPLLVLSMQNNIMAAWNLSKKVQIIPFLTRLADTMCLSGGSCCCCVSQEIKAGFIHPTKNCYYLSQKKLY